jgi:hypothetical protein
MTRRQAFAWEYRRNRYLGFSRVTSAVLALRQAFEPLPF